MAIGRGGWEIPRSVRPRLIACAILDGWWKAACRCWRRYARHEPVRRCRSVVPWGESSGNHGSYGKHWPFNTVHVEVAYSKLDMVSIVNHRLIVVSPGRCCRVVKGLSAEPPTDRRVPDQLAVFRIQHELGIGPHLLGDDGAVGALIAAGASAAGRLARATDVQPILGA